MIGVSDLMIELPDLNDCGILLTHPMAECAYLNMQLTFLMIDMSDLATEFAGMQDFLVALTTQIVELTYVMTVETFYDLYYILCQG